MLLPMGHDRASNLILRTRLFLERALRGDVDRGLINHFAQVCILTRYVARAGYARLPTEHFDAVEAELAQALNDFHTTGNWGELSDRLLAGLRSVVNEYDRMLGAVRLEIFVNADSILPRLSAIRRSKSDPPGPCVTRRLSRLPAFLFVQLFACPLAGSSHH